ncbi:MAG TPA: hypothetical protein VGI20_00740 [Rhizomicrobium sp.]|jgi:ElaB/YqjD/DUF883 family membrane-anchored ribosome-binding protein
MGIFRRRKKGVKKIAAQFDALQTDLAAFGKDARKLANGVGDAAEDAVERAERAYNGLGKWTSGNIGSMRQGVRSQPLAACLVSLGVGTVLGALLLRR